MKKAVYRLILFAAITAFVLSLCPSVKADPNDTQTKQNQCPVSDSNVPLDADKAKPAPHQKSAVSKQNQCPASDTKTLCDTDKREPPRHQKSAVCKENSQLQLAKEQLRGEFYKDSQDNLKWAIKVIIGLVTAYIGLALVTMGYLVFKNKKDYTEAVADAKEAARDAKDAAKNARELEKEAQQLLADIKKQAETTVEEIKETSREQKEKSSKEFERQRKFSELVNKAWKAMSAEDYEIADDYYRQIVEDLKEDNDHEIYNNWGIILTNLAESKEGKEAEELFNQAFEKYKKAIEVEPEYCSAYKNWSIALIDMSKLKEGKDVEDLLKQAEEKCLKVESIKAGQGAYNLACVYALRGNEDKCQEWLKVGEKAGTLPTREHAMADDDLKSVRDKDWFKELRWNGE